MYIKLILFIVKQVHGVLPWCIAQQKRQPNISNTQMSDAIRKIAPADIIARAIKHHSKKNTRSKNLIDVVKDLPKNGNGAAIKRDTWPEHMYYTLTKVKVHHDGYHGKAWGVLTYGNKERYGAKPHEIHGVHKRGIWQTVSQEQVQEGKQDLAQAQERHRILLLTREQNAKFAPNEAKL